MRSNKSAKLRWKWWKGRERWDVFHIGEPDFFAYMIRHQGGVWGGQAWCWILTMPRGGRQTAKGWATSAHEAKREVEAKILELSQ